MAVSKFDRNFIYCLDVIDIVIGVVYKIILNLVLVYVASRHGKNNLEKWNILVPERRLDIGASNLLKMNSEKFVAKFENSRQNSRKGKVVAHVFVTHSKKLDRFINGTKYLFYVQRLIFNKVCFHLQWGSENRTCSVFEWSKAVWLWIGPVFKWFRQNGSHFVN